MHTKLILGCKVLAFAIVLATLTATAFCFLLSPSQADSIPARTLQGPLYPAAINVTVTSDIGRPIPYATVKVAGNGATFLTNSEGNVLVDVQAEVSGTNFILWANKTGYVNSTAGQILAHANVTSDLILEVVGGKILGTVMSASVPSAPIIGANVSISALGYSVTVTNVDGSYILEGLPGGTYSVTGEASGYISKSQDVKLPVGGSAQSNFVLTSQTGAITGYVFNAGHDIPLSEANVSVRVGTITVTVTSEADGRYNITDLPTGSYTLTASKPGFYDNITAGVPVSKGNWTKNINFTLQERPTLLHGVVRSGNLLLVQVNISVSGTAFFNLSGADGSYAIANLTAGTYTVNASKEGYVPFSETVVIPPGGEAELLINLTGVPGAILRGVVVSSEVDHTPLTYVLVTIIGSSKGQMSVLSNIKGEFEFTGLSAGNYTLEFESEGFRPVSSSIIVVEQNKTTEMNFQMTPIRHGFSGFIFGFDMAHSMMILALFLTIIILAVAVYLRIRTFQAPESAPAVYDEAEEEAPPEGEPADDDHSAANGEKKQNGG